MEEVTTGEVVGTTLTWVVTYGPCGERVKGRPTKTLGNHSPCNGNVNENGV